MKKLLLCLFVVCAACGHASVYLGDRFEEWNGASLYYFPVGVPIPVIVNVEGVDQRVRDAFFLAIQIINKAANCTVFYPAEEGRIVIKHDERPFSGGAMRSFDGTMITECVAGVNEQIPMYNMKNVAAHELLHCLGFRHRNDRKKDIMNPVVDWDATISPTDADILFMFFCGGIPSEF